MSYHDISTVAARHPSADIELLPATLLAAKTKTGKVVWRLPSGCWTDDHQIAHEIAAKMQRIMQDNLRRGGVYRG